MKKIFLAVALLTGFCGAANAEIKGKTINTQVVNGELSDSVMAEYNAAQDSLNKLRNKYMNEMADEMKKGGAADQYKLYNTACIKLIPVLNEIDNNILTLMPQLKNQNTINDMKRILATNKSKMTQIKDQCQQQRLSLQ